jgi:hypothetical protein
MLFNADGMNATTHVHIAFLHVKTVKTFKHTPFSRFQTFTFHLGSYSDYLLRALADI